MILSIEEEPKDKTEQEKRPSNILLNVLLAFLTVGVIFSIFLSIKEFSQNISKTFKKFGEDLRNDPSKAISDIADSNLPEHIRPVSKEIIRSLFLTIDAISNKDIDKNSQTEILDFVKGSEIFAHPISEEALKGIFLISNAISNKDSKKNYKTEILNFINTTPLFDDELRNGLLPQVKTFFMQQRASDFISKHPKLIVAIASFVVLPSPILLIYKIYKKCRNK